MLECLHCNPNGANYWIGVRNKEKLHKAEEKLTKDIEAQGEEAGADDYDTDNITSQEEPPKKKQNKVKPRTTKKNA